MKKTWEEINQKIQQHKAVVLTAAEFKELAQTVKPEELCRQVDVVTAATYSPMCSSSVVINFGHAVPPIRMETISLNGVPAYEGLAAVDAILGATAEQPGNNSYGGAHVIEELIQGKTVQLEASGKGTDCYPRKQISASIHKDTVNEFYFFNPRNAYQNYGAAVNSSERILKTYMGILKPFFGNINYATTGEWSPLLNDPYLRTIGIGTPVFLGGAHGHVVYQGTQFNTEARVNAAGIPVSGARTLALLADAKQASPEFIAAGRIAGYGVSLFVGIGFAIPVLDADMAQALSVRNRNITQLIRDYSQPDKPIVAETTYEELASGTVTIGDKSIPTACLSSRTKALRIMELLKAHVLAGSFPLTPPIQALPVHHTVHNLTNYSGIPAAIKETSNKIFIQERCINCGACTVHCPVHALQLHGNPATLHYNSDLCTACGACFEACMRGALCAE